MKLLGIILIALIALGGCLEGDDLNNITGNMTGATLPEGEPIELAPEKEEIFNQALEEYPGAESLTDLDKIQLRNFVADYPDVTPELVNEQIAMLVNPQEISESDLESIEAMIEDAEVVYVDEPQAENFVIGEKVYSIEEINSLPQNEQEQLFTQWQAEGAKTQ